MRERPAWRSNLPKARRSPRYTYSTIGLYRAALFEPPWCDIPRATRKGIKAALAPLLRAAMDQAQVSAELYTGALDRCGHTRAAGAQR